MLIYSYLYCKRSIMTLLLAAALAAQVDVGLSPMRVEFPAVAGKAYSGSLALTNAGSAKARIRAEFLDFYVDETTTPQFVANVPAEAEHSCRAWLSLNPMELEVGPKSQAVVRYTVRVPANATERSYHCALGFRTLPPATEASVTAMHTAVRLIAVVYPIVGKQPVSGEIKELKLEQTAGDSGPLWRAVVVMQNSGLTMYRPVGKLDLVDSTGAVVESEQMPPFPALPKRQQRYLVPIKSALASGQYTLRARIEVGHEVQEASATVTAAPAVSDPPAQ